MKLLVLLAFVGLAFASWDKRCVDRRSNEACRGDRDPCRDVTSNSCPQFFFYACPRVDRRNNCSCRFIRESTRREIRRSDCFRQIERCGRKSCGDDSDCVETSMFCKHRGCNFDRKIEAKCMKRSCDNFNCSENKECRMMRARDGGRRPRCMWRDARDCSERMCHWDERCEMRMGRPMCREETRMEKCRNTWCREGYRCDNSTCTRMSCDEMNCRRDEECMDWNRGWEMIRRCIRRPTRERRCEDIDCDEGFECEMRRERNNTHPTCRRRRHAAPHMSPPHRFEEVSCREDEDRAMCEMENRDRFSRCWRRDARWPNSSRDDRWRRNWGRDDRRRPPRDCSELRCWENERCRTFRYMGMQIASCHSDRTPRDCMSARCQRDERCHLLNNTDVRSHAVCFRNLSRREEPSREAERCEELRCEGRFTCFRRRDENGRWRARCRRSWLNKSVRCWRQSRSDSNRDWWRMRNDTRPWSDERRPDERRRDGEWRRDEDRRMSDEDRRRSDEVWRHSDEDWRRSDEDWRRSDKEWRRHSDEDWRRFRDEKKRRSEDDRRRYDDRRNWPDQCSEIECGRNETCFVDIREEGRRQARCIPRWLRGYGDRMYCWARTCEDMECEEGFRCEERRENREERIRRMNNETREDRNRWQRRWDEERRTREDRRREDRDSEDRRARENRMREAERRREDEKRNNTWQEEDRNCDSSMVDESKEKKRDDRCERRTDDRRRDDRDRRERRRWEDWERERECRHQDRERDDSRRCEDREREERWKREDQYMEWKRRDECYRRGARCVRNREV